MSSPNLLQVTPFRQTAGLCGPASLKIALSYFGLDYSESYLTQLTGANTDQGTEHTGMVDAIEQLGGTAVVQENANLTDIKDFVVRQKLPVIIGWFDQDGDHYSVVVGVTAKFLITVDPAVGGTRRLPKAKFPAIWFDFVGPENKIVSWHWLMAVNFHV